MGDDEGEGEGEGPGQSWALAPVQGRTWKYKSWKQRNGLVGEFHPLRSKHYVRKEELLPGREVLNE